MATNYWVKLYHEMLDDTKIGMLRIPLRWRFVECLLAAGEHDHDGELPETTKLAWRLRCGAEGLESELNELGDAGLLDLVDGIWHVTKFAKRQEPSAAAKRMREYRARKKEQSVKKEEEKILDIDTDTDTYRARNALRNESVTENLSLDNDYGNLEAAVCRATKRDALMLGPNDKRLIEGMFKSGHTDKQVEAAYFPGGWWHVAYWKGQKGQAPMIQDINDTIGQAIDWDGKIPSGNNQPSEPAGFPGIREMQEEIANG